MGHRIKSMDNAFSINIHATKELVHGDTTFIVGELTNWFGDNTGINWVGITMRDRDVLDNYFFGNSEEEIITLYGTLHGNDEFKDIDRSIEIPYHHKVEKPTGWKWNNGTCNNFQTCVLYSYMTYEAIYVDDVYITINDNSFDINGNVFDMDNNELLFRFKAAPGICDYNIDYYSHSGGKIDASEVAHIEESKICGVSNRDVDNAIYFVIANKIYNAMIKTLPISVLVKTCYYINDAYKKNLTTLTATDYIKELFTDGTIDRFVAEFMMSLIDKHGNVHV